MVKRNSSLTQPALAVLGCILLAVLFLFVSMMGAAAFEGQFPPFVRYHRAVMIVGALVAALLSFLGIPIYWRMVQRASIVRGLVYLGALAFLSHGAFLFMFGQFWGNAHDPSIRRIEVEQSDRADLRRCSVSVV